MVASAIGYYNPAILSPLLEKYRASGNEKALALIKLTLPGAYRHVHLNARYGFREGWRAIDLDALI